MNNQVIIINGKRIFVDRIVSYWEEGDELIINTSDFNKIKLPKLKAEALDMIIEEQYIISDFDAKAEYEEDDENFLDDTL